MASQGRAAFVRTRLSALQRLIATSDDHPVAQRKMLETAIRALGMDFGSVGFVEGDIIVPIVSVSLTGSVPISERTALAETLIGAMLAGGETTAAYGDLAGDERLRHHLQVRDRGVRSFVGTSTEIDGRPYFFSLGSQSPQRSFDDDDVAYVELLAAISARFQQLADREAHIEHFRFHDRLTGLPLENKFVLDLELAVTAARERGQHLVLFCLDLDVPRLLDEYDNAVTESLVREAGARLGELIGENVSVYRGGECDFYILALTEQTRPRVEMLERSILAAFSKPFVQAGRKIALAPTVAFSLYPDEAADAASLWRGTAAMLKSAKAQGLARPANSSLEKRARSEDKRRLVRDLQNAVEREELRLHFQPFVDVASGRVLGVEALVRWMTPSAGLLYPADFIPLTEDAHVVVTMGSWVMLRAAQMARRIASEYGPLIVAFNVATGQLQDPAFFERLQGAIEESGARPDLLEIEITESAALADADLARAVLGQCRGLGLKIALDDFGTGYSSLAYLRDLPADIVKIDRSFISSLPADESIAISGAIIALSHRLGRVVQAEGVETIEQLNWLRSERCDYAQGYHVGHPLEPEALMAFLRAQPNA